jgi:hypothetical protein
MPVTDDRGCTLQRSNCARDQHGVEDAISTKQDACPALQVEFSIKLFVCLMTRRLRRDRDPGAAAEGHSGPGGRDREPSRRDGIRVPCSVSLY